MTTTTDTIKEKIDVILLGYVVKYKGKKRYLIGKTGKELLALFESLISKTREELIEEIHPFDLVEDCNPDSTPTEHAYHQGTWDSYLKLEKILASLKEKQIK